MPRPRRPNGRRYDGKSSAGWNCRERWPKPGPLAGWRRSPASWSSAGTRPRRSCERLVIDSWVERGRPGRPTSSSASRSANGRRDQDAMAWTLRASSPRSASPRPDVRTLADHFRDAEERGKTGHGFSRVTWLETLPDLDPSARPERLVAEEGYERWHGRGALGYLTLARDLRRAAGLAAAACARDRRAADLPDRDARLLGAPARRGRARRRAHDHLAAAARPSRRRAEAGRDESACDRDSELRRRARRRRRLHGGGHARRGDRGAREARGRRALRRRAGAQGVRARDRAAAARRLAGRRGLRRGHARRAAGGRSRAGLRERAGDTRLPGDRPRG